MTEPRTLLLDNEAVQALGDVSHPKHHRVLAHIEVTIGRRRRGERQRVIVPTAVRVEAGWSRTDPSAATLNRLGAADSPLDTTMANAAAEIVRHTGVSVPDAHLGAAAQYLPAGDVVVLTSDPDDIRRAADPRRITAIRV